MPYDERLAERVRDAMSGERGVTEKKMFGGLSFLMKGNMVCGVTGEKLVVRLGEEGAAAALGKRHTAPMDFTGRPLKSMVYVLPSGTKTKASVASWVRKAVGFATELDGKKQKTSPKKK